MEERLSPRACLDLKRRIAEMDRVRSQMRLELIRTRVQPGNVTEEDLADTENNLILLEDELSQLTKRYDEGCPS